MVTNSAAHAAEAAKDRPVKRFRPGHLSNYMFVLPGVLFMVCFLVFPIVYNLLLSFQNVTLQNLKGAHEFVGWSNYSAVFKDELFGISFKNSAVFTGGSIAAQFLLGFVLALFFNRKFPGRDILRSVMLLSWMMPIVITATLFKWMLSGDHGVFNHILQSAGILDKPVFWLTEEKTALWGTVAANIWVGIPFNMVILLSGLQAMPDHLYEAAKIDGAGRLRQFASITLPLLRPTILVLLMLGIIYTFKVFDLIFIMTGGGPVNASTVFPMYAYRLAFVNFEFSLGAAVSSVMFGVLIAFAAVYLWLTRKEERL
ncbi:carbohydrate ABC transporter permease [Paenibacillus hamazuiensis]|uniref:carbohydrate ABC transporter permease n=1 Tax=Paenibacillus hamazuiensis TaxID=2936508 RepID=UPI00200F22D0|nr:sugar ABC transporter permease [Paenibacillus hamazuiensis]